MIENPNFDPYSEFDEFYRWYTERYRPYVFYVGDLARYMAWKGHKTEDMIYAPLNEQLVIECTTLGMLWVELGLINKDHHIIECFRFKWLLFPRM